MPAAKTTSVPRATTAVRHRAAHDAGAATRIQRSAEAAQADLTVRRAAA